MNRNLSLILALLILAGTVSCGDSGKTSESTTDDSSESIETTLPEVLTDDVPDISMDGFVFSVYHNNPTQMTWTNLTLDVSESNGEALKT